MRWAFLNSVVQPFITRLQETIICIYLHIIAEGMCKTDPEYPHNTA